MKISKFRNGLKVWSSSVWLTVLIVFSFSAFANEGGGGNNACKADFEKYCKDVKPGDGRIMKCMKEHENDFSQACQTQMAEKKEMMEKKMQEAREACKGDVEKYCMDVKAGDGRIMKCLAEHKDQLSDSCRQHLPSKDEHKGMGDHQGMDDHKGMQGNDGSEKE